MPKELIVCIPGLGGHITSLGEYRALLPSRDVRFIELVDHEKALADILALSEQAESIVFVCNCYGLQIALRAAEKMPGKVRALVAIEAYFAQFHPLFRSLAIPVNNCILAIIRFAGRLGFRRTRFWTSIDYARLARYPLWVQPIFDMLWQPLDTYFGKTGDIVAFTLPPRIDIPTLFLLSPNGYFTDGDHRVEVQKIFTRSEIVEVESKSHNLVSLAAPKIAAIMESWLSNLPSA